VWTIIFRAWRETDFVSEQENRPPWSGSPEGLFDAFREKIHHVPKGYDENNPALRRKTLMENHSTFGFAPKPVLFSSIPRSKT